MSRDASGNSAYASKRRWHALTLTIVMQQTVSEVLLQELTGAGARHAFVVPGGACTYLIDAAARNPGISVIPMLQEGGAGIAAESYAQFAGRLGIAIVTSGPGSTNILTAVAAAYTDSTPMVVLAGQVKVADLLGSPRGRQFGFQHLPMGEIVPPITKGFFSIQDPSQVFIQITEAIGLATSGRQGPVWVEVPLDIQNQPVHSAELLHEGHVGTLPPQPPARGYQDFADALRDALEGSMRPCLLVGNGVRSAGAQDLARDLARDLGIPALVTWKMIDFLPEDDPLLAGRPGALAPWHANLVQQQCDLLLVLGARLDHAQVGYRISNLAPQARVFRVEVDAAEAAKWSDPRVLTLVGDAKQAITAIADSTATLQGLEQWGDWRARVAEGRLAFPAPSTGLAHHDAPSMYEVTHVLSDMLPEDAVISSGSSGQGIEIFLQAFKTKPGQRVYCSAALGSMGFGFASAIGAHYASDGSPVWCIEGDGSAAMALHDLSAIGVSQLPVKIILLDNSGYMSIRMSQQRLVESRCGFDVESGLPLPDIGLVAQSVGVTVVRSNTIPGFADAITTAGNEPGPVMVIMALRDTETSYPKVSTRLDDHGRLTTSALDDMDPTLAEMHGSRLDFPSDG